MNEIDLVRLGRLCIAGADLEASGMIEQLLLSDDRRHRGHGYRAILRAVQGRHAEALADHDAVVRLRPRWSGGYFKRGYYLLGRRKFSDAERDFSSAIVIEEQMVEDGGRVVVGDVVYLLRALARRELGRLSKVQRVNEIRTDLLRVGDETRIWALGRVQDRRAVMESLRDE